MNAARSSLLVSLVTLGWIALGSPWPEASAADPPRGIAAVKAPPAEPPERGAPGMEAPPAELPEGVAPPDAVLLPPPAPRAASATADSIIAAMVGAVNQDSIYAFLEKLTGEALVDFGWGTAFLWSRYYNNIGAEYAADEVLALINNG